MPGSLSGNSPYFAQLAWHQWGPQWHMSTLLPGVVPAQPRYHSPQEY
jgi:hypothetical protein